ncbi:acyl-CoA dehydrogenase family protein [Streptomyces sp. NBC_00096]|uniref:acyl-CoA dehydrogenase family protein n=1 Tax=Streptomyces sp. NBC_00096 TaxID=2975650 RepID=UPI00386ABC2F
MGACERAFHESLNHARTRLLYGRRVTDFPHIRRIFSDAYLRLLAMKMFTNRAVDYMRSAHEGDRRYILFTAMSKTKVTTEAEQVVTLLWDAIDAKGLQAETHLNWVARDLPGLPRLEGTVHVNITLILKFLPAMTASSSGRGPPAGSARSASMAGAPPSTTSRRGQRGPLPGTGRRAPRAADRLRSGRRPAAGTRLQASDRPAVHTMGP